MAINTTTELTLLELAELFGLDSIKAQFLTEQGVELSVNLKNIQLQKGSNVAVANVKMSVLNMVKADKLGPASKSMIKSELATAYDNMCEALQFGTSIFDKGMHDIDVEETLKEILEEDKFTDEEGNDYEVKPKVVKKKKAAKTKIKEGIMNTGTVALIDAKEVFQPVKGSGGTSIYFAIGIGEINAAARVKGSKVSIRVEGDGLKDPDVREQLIEAGLSEASETHFSIHLQVKPELIAKTIGAVLFAISQGHAFTAMASDVSPIMGKGS